MLRDLTNVLVHLRPAPVVARVPMTLGRLRGPAWEKELVTLSSFLAERGAPVVAPARVVPPGPHEREGLVVSFWEHVEHDPGRFDAAEVGRSLAELHIALREYTRRLPRFERLDEIRRVLDDLDSEHASVLREAHALLAAGEPLDEGELQPIHGDVHFRNVLWSPDGPRWTDLENACLGPVEYDLAGLAWRDEPGTREALEAYGEHDSERIRHMTPYLATFLAAWTLDLARRHASVMPFAQERFDRVRSWLEEPA